MKAELDLPPLPDGWATGPVEIGYGVPPAGSKALVLTCLGWDKWTGSDTPFVYAVRNWVPQIVTAGLLAAGWIVIDSDGTWWYSMTKPVWDEMSGEWTMDDCNRMTCLCILETPQVTGEKAIWEIK